MVRSMTGYGQGSAESGGVRVSVTLRAVNNRFADVRLRLPDELAPLESEVRRKVLSWIRRGRVELLLNLERLDPMESPIGLNRPFVEALIVAARALREEFGLGGEFEVGGVLAIPGVLKSPAGREASGELESRAVEQALEAALQSLDHERRREGRELQTDLLARIGRMEGLRAAIRDRAGELPLLLHRKLLERVRTLTPGIDLDPDRVAQEVAFLADRCDVTEELVRLEGHLGQARTLLGEPDGQPIGKRLDFLLQEIHRETNTVNSKAADLQVGRWTLELKAEAEKVREQVQNLE